jgi:multiple sugar transport system substrate-binding protein
LNGKEEMVMTGIRHLTKLTMVSFVVVAILFLQINTTAQCKERYIPSKEPPYKGITLNFICDGGHNYFPWISTKYPELNEGKRIEKLLGVKLVGTEKPTEQVFPTIMADLISGAGHYNILVFFPMYNGRLMGGDWLLPLNDYIEKFPVDWSDNYEIFRTAYCMWGDTIYGLPYDGDILNLYYRKDIFEDASMKSKFKEKYGYELIPPETYSQYNDIAEFFNGWDWDGDGQPEYGTAEYHKLDLGYGYWVNRFGSGRGIYFDEKMNPGINSQAGIQALEDLEVSVKNSPPGILNFGALEVFDAFLDGMTAMLLTWPDIGPRVGSGKFQVKPEQVGFALVPGYKLNGELSRRSWIGVGRLMAISKLTPKDKREAAFQVIRYMNSPNVSLRYVSHGMTGEDSFRHFHDQNPELWLHKHSALADYLEMKAVNTEHGYPDLYLPGTEEYTDSLGRNIIAYLAGQISSAKEALDKTAKEWNQITDKLGRDKQIKAWEAQVKIFKRLGLY